MFKFFEKKEKLEPLNVDDTSVVAMAEGELIDISTVPDDIFSKKLKPIIFGGGQEFGLRSGTENVQYILAFGKLCENLNIQEKQG